MTVSANFSGSLGNWLVSLILLPFKIIVRAMQWSFILLGVIVLGYSAKEFYDYHKFAHAYPSGASCDQVLEQMGLMSPDRTQPVRCINASGQEQTETIHMVFFSAISTNAEGDRAGDGWITFAKLELDNGDITVLQEFLPIGFRPENESRFWPDKLVSYHADIQPHLPQPLEPMITGLVKAVYHPMRLADHYLDQMADNPVPLNNTFLQSPGYQVVMGSTNQAVLAVAVSEVEYENAKRYKNRFISKEWALQLHDGTTLVHAVADRVNLYTPPQILDPLPYQTVVSLSEMNRAYGR